MPSTNTRQDTSVLMYLKVLLISIFRWHGGGKGLGGTPASLPPLVTSAGTEERIRLELEPLVQEVLVGGVRTSSVPRRDGVAWAGGNPFSSPQTPNKPQASSRATKARPHRLAGDCMLQLAPGRVQQRLRVVSLETNRGMKTGHFCQLPQPRLCRHSHQPGRRYPRGTVT